MKPFMKMLPALGLVFGATLAMAMNFATPSNANDPKFGLHENEVYDVTDRTVGPGPEQYQCNAATTDCLYEDASLTIPVENSEGEFMPGSGLTPIEN